MGAMTAPSAALMAPGATAPTKEAMYSFLRSGMEMMKSDETRKVLQDPVRCPEPGSTLIEMQRKGWDCLGVDRDVGCKALDAMTPDGDAELMQIRQEFVFTAMRTFLRSVEDRRPKELETKKRIPRETIIQFMDACNTRMDLPETRQALFNFLKENKQAPNQMIIDIQKDLLEAFGWEREHGCRMLSKASEHFPTDKELMQRFMMWKNKAEMTCMAVMKAAGAAPGHAQLQQMMHQQLSASPEMERLAEKAKKEIETMTPTERGELVQKMEKKIHTILKLPEKDREEYVKKLMEEDKVEIVKTKILMMSLHAKQMQEKEHNASTAQQTMDGPGASVPSTGDAGGSSGSYMAPPSVAPPSQMTM